MNFLSQSIFSLLRFIRKQLPRLKLALLERHNIGLARLLVWALLLAAFSTISSFLGAYWAGPKSLLSLSYFLSIPQSIVFTFVVFLFSGFFLKLWVQYLSKKEIQIEQWWEFYFLCYLPIWLGGLVSVFFMGLIGSFFISVLCLGLTLYLFYIGTQNLFLLDPKQRSINKVFIFGIALFFIFSQGKSLSMNAQLLSSGGGLENLEWSPKFPIEIEKKLRSAYASDEEKERASLQYAKSLWEFMDEDKDYNLRLQNLYRSSICMSRRFGENLVIEEMRRIKSYVLWSADLTNRFLEVDQRYSGSYDIPDGEAVCDP